MGKTIRNSHIIGEVGVIKFADYCNQHKPYILFREVFKSDFGIDGEVELTRTTEERKIEPTGEILKIQIKSVGSDRSYIKNETATKFEFYPRQDDIEYWEKYKKNGIEVVLVIYDQRIEQLYSKKVFDTDLYIAKQNIKKGTKKNVSAITFDKVENALTFGRNDFTEKFSHSFRNRVNYDVKEHLLSNFLKLKLHPKLLYCYPSKNGSFKSSTRIIKIMGFVDFLYLLAFVLLSYQ